MKTLLKITLVLLFFSSCKTQNIFETPKENTDKTGFTYDANYEYRIRKNDKIALSVWGEDDLSVGSVYGIYNSNEVYGKWLLVDANGTIEIPKIGKTLVVDKTIPQLKEELRAQLKQWLVNPIIDIKVLNKEITILGEVRNPSTIQVDRDNVTLLEMISKTGGFEFYANLKAIKILRQEGENVRVTHLDVTSPKDILSTNIQLHPSDIVIVPSKKNKEFDKRVATIIPFTTTITAAAILLGVF